MLSPPDAGLVRRDPTFLGLPVLLDPEAFVAALSSAVPTADLGPARSTYVRYKPGMDCMVAYQLDVGGREVEVHAKAYGPNAGVKLKNAYERPSVSGPLGEGRIILEDHAIVVSTFPNDTRLRSLPRLADAETRNSMLRKMTPDRPDLWECTLQKIRYKPERRYVAQLIVEGRSRAILKVYAKPRYRVAKNNTRVFKSRESLRLARRLGSSDRHHVLALEWLPGHLLREAISAPEPQYEAVAAAGAALAELHAQNAKRLLEVLDRGAEAATLHAVADGLGLVCPHLGGQAHDLVRRLTDRLRHKPLASHAIHGDFDAEQVLLTGKDVAILDLDRAARGDPAADLGLFIANLERAALRGDISLDRAESLGDNLIEGYRDTARHPVLAHLRLYTAAGLLRLAPEPFRYREPDWPERTETILKRAEEILQSASRQRSSASKGEAARKKETDERAEPMNRNPYLFVGGCARSSTTLLQRMLDHHPRLAVANDTHFIPRAIEDVPVGVDPPLTPELVERVRTYRRFYRLDLSDDAVAEAAARSRTYREFVSALYSEYGWLHGKPLAGEKTPDYVRHIPRLHALFPEAKFVHIIRDGRDVALSVLEWARDGKGPSKVALWDEEPVAVCALWWRWQVGIGRRDGGELGPALYREVRYEELVAQPEEVLKDLADFLELPHAPEMSTYYEGKTRHKPGLSAKKAWLPPTLGLRDWRTEFSERDLELFEALAGDLLSELDYEQGVERVSPEVAAVAERCKAWWESDLARRQAKQAPHKKG